MVSQMITLFTLPKMILLQTPEILSQVKSTTNQMDRMFMKDAKLIIKEMMSLLKSSSQSLEVRNNQTEVKLSNQEKEIRSLSTSQIMALQV